MSFLGNGVAGVTTWTERETEAGRGSGRALARCMGQGGPEGDTQV